MSKALSPKPNQPEHDLVYTPKALAKQIISHFQPIGSILDPCAGAGAFYDQFPETCIKHWCELSQGKDFFSFDTKVDWIITNPPWSKTRQFLEHSYKITDNIVFLITVNHIVTKARLRKMIECGFWIKEIHGVQTPSTKDKWPQSGFQLCACHIQRNFNGMTTWSGIFG